MKFPFRLKFLLMPSIFIWASVYSKVVSFPSQFSLKSSSFLSQVIKKSLPVCEVAFARDPFLENVEDISHVLSIFGDIKEFTHSGMYNVQINSVIQFRRFDDIHRLSSGGSCTHVVILLNHWEENIPKTLFNLLTPPYTSIARKDEDNFFLLSNKPEILQKLLESPTFGAKVKFKLGLDPDSFRNPSRTVIKTVDFYGGLPGPKLVSFKAHFDNLQDIFPDFTRNFQGHPLKLGIPKAPFRFEIELRSDGRYHPKRGTYKPWLDTAMQKLNFTYNCFYTSYGGGTGIQFENGSWVGAVADVRDNVADMAFFIAHIYNRHQVVDWSAPLSYEWIVFVSHKPKYFYSPYAIFWPFTIPLWTFFLLSILCMTLCLKFVASGLAKKLDSNHLREVWTVRKSFDYIFATFLEQDRNGPSNLPYTSIRMLCAAWLLFSLVTANAYRAKMVSVMAFPDRTFVPTTYEELVDSEYGAGMFVIGKGDAAYTIFQQGRGRVYEGIFARLKVMKSPLECLLKAVHEDFGCLMWEGLNDYLNVRNISKRGVGRSPTQVSVTKTSFINDGLIYERRAIIRKSLDDTILAARDTGLTKKWIDLDFDGIRKDRFEWEMSQEKNSTGHHHTFEDSGPRPLSIDNCKAAMYILFGGVFTSLVCFLWEWFPQKGTTFIKIIKNVSVFDQGVPSSFTDSLKNTFGSNTELNLSDFWVNKKHDTIISDEYTEIE